MIDTSMPDELVTILHAFMASTDAPSHEALRDWVARYPQYARELTDFTVAWSLSETLPMDPEVEALPADALVQRGMAAVRGVLDATTARAAEEALAGLAPAAKARGLTMPALAERCDLSIALLRKLDRRLIRFASIPHEAIAAIAEAIGRDASAVARYLQGSPTLAQGASYYAREAPTVGEQEDFFAALRADPTMPADLRRRWLDRDGTENR